MTLTAYYRIEEEMEIQDLWSLVGPRFRSQLKDGLELNLVSEFCQVNEATVYRWTIGEQPPRGERLLRLWFLLAAAGSDSPEMAQIPTFCRLLAELVVYKVVTLEEACDIAGVKNSQTLFRILRGQPPLHPRLNLDEVDELYGSRLRQAKDELVIERSGASQAAVTADEPVLKVTAKPEPRSGGYSVSNLIECDGTIALATLLSAALPLVRYFDSDGCSPEERSRLRRLLGDDGMFELSNHFNALCSERSRNEGKRR